MSNEIDALADTCTQVMSTVTGEFIFDDTKGVNYPDHELADNTDGVARFIIDGSAALAEIEGVTSVVSFFANNTGQYIAVVTTDLGQITVHNIDLTGVAV
jgi:hypothetical protein